MTDARASVSIRRWGPGLAQGGGGGGVGEPRTVQYSYGEWGKKRTIRFANWVDDTCHAAGVLEHLPILASAPSERIELNNQRGILIHSFSRKDHQL